MRPETPHRIRVLVVDDEEPVARAIARALGDRFDVTLAHSVDGAQRALDHASFDVVVSDICMPGKSGLDLHAWLEASSPEIASRVVFITGGSPNPSERARLARLPNPCLGKPFHTEELEDIVLAVAKSAGSRAP